jgi:hypothetical protein
MNIFKYSLIFAITILVGYLVYNYGPNLFNKFVTYLIL